MAIEDASELTRKAWRVLENEKYKLELPDLYPPLPFKKKHFEDADPVKDLNVVRGQLDTLSDMHFHALVQLSFKLSHYLPVNSWKSYRTTTNLERTWRNISPG